MNLEMKFITVEKRLYFHDWRATKIRIIDCGLKIEQERVLYFGEVPKQNNLKTYMMTTCFHIIIIINKEKNPCHIIMTSENAWEV